MIPQLNRNYAWAIALGLVARSSLVSAGPCDIYASGGTPCVAAHGTTRALHDSYTGPLYQVKRGSDGATTDIAPRHAGGVANATHQDTFCAGTTCLITIIYDQSGHGNHLSQAPPGHFIGPDSQGYDNLASAIGAPVTLNGQKAYGVFISPGTGYRNNAAKNTATGDEAEGLYAVLDGTHYNNGCCFDYGNAEVSGDDTGNGHMEAIYFGDLTAYGTGSGSGPWIMADLENGLFSGFNAKNNAEDPSLSYRFISAAVKGGPNKWAIRGGNAASGPLSTFYNGSRPNARGYNPMSKEGAIILGIGGHNSKLTVGSSISLRATTLCCTTRYVAHNGSTVNTQVVSSSSSAALKQQASWRVRTGLANSECFSFESVDTPNSFLMHNNFVLLLKSNDGTKALHEAATFCPQLGLNGKGNSIRSWSYPTRYFRHYDNVLYAASNGGVHKFDNPASFNDDVSWVVSASFA
uniref:Alpha-L-arabinofuranosidase B n=1 Tax=Penicillium canescens TaxID=5083 RepID=ABFB_PENCN|nr:RecName: Full=Alpha-L-arabinofuranosidase B; Short=ABF B; Short=Arabinosidase B; AltName: Full=Alpha-L-arabinofuranosidase of 60kDa; Short=AF-60; Flags: Precursor [Penicillium canescens]AHA36630.1 alpha-L-arabinofuranosidase [Penicillium canescens]